MISFNNLQEDFLHVDYVPFESLSSYQLLDQEFFDRLMDQVRILAHKHSTRLCPLTGGILQTALCPGLLNKVACQSCAHLCPVEKAKGSRRGDFPIRPIPVARQVLNHVDLCSNAMEQSQSYPTSSCTPFSQLALAATKMSISAQLTRLALQEGSRWLRSSPSITQQAAYSDTSLAQFF